MRILRRESASNGSWAAEIFLGCHSWFTGYRLGILYLIHGMSWQKGGLFNAERSSHFDVLSGIKGKQFKLNHSGKKVICRTIDLDTHSMVTAMHNLTAATRYKCAVKVDLVVYKVKVWSPRRRTVTDTKIKWHYLDKKCFVQIAALPSVIWCSAVSLSQ